MPVLHTLRNSDVFGAIENPSRWEDAFTRKVYDRGERLWWEGERASYFTLITSGAVKIVKNRADGGQTILQLFGAGEFIGIGAAYRKKPYPASALAMTRVVTLQILHRDLAAIWDYYPTVHDLVMEKVLACNYRLVQRIHDLSVNDAEHRLALLFSQLCEKWGEPFADSSSVRIPYYLSRAELAELVNVREETAIRLMRRWHLDEFVETLSDGFVVHDCARLEYLCSQDN